MLSLGLLIKERATSKSTETTSFRELAFALVNKQGARGYGMLFEGLGFAMEKYLDMPLQVSSLSDDSHRGIEKARAAHMETSCRVGDFNHLCGASRQSSKKVTGEDGESKHLRVWRTGLFKTVSKILSNEDLMPRIQEN